MRVVCVAMEKIPPPGDVRRWRRFAKDGRTMEIILADKGDRARHDTEIGRQRR
jgi:hypothetical protein